MSRILVVATERSREVPIEGLETIDSDNIQEFLGPLREHASISPETLQSRIVFDGSETIKFFEAVCEVEGRERGVAIYVAAMSMIGYYKRRGIESLIGLVVEAKRKTITVAAIGVIPNFPDGMGEKQKAQLYRRAEEVGQDFQDMLSDWKTSISERLSTFELPASKPKSVRRWD